MATITYGNTGYGVDMLATSVDDVLDYNKASWSTMMLKLFDDSMNYTLFNGTGLKVSSSSGRPTDITAGTVTSIKVVIDGTTAVSVTGLSVSAAKLGDAIFAGNDATFQALILAGNDTVNGTNYADGLVGGLGNDTLKGNDGDDDFLGGIGADKLFGGSGFDTAYYMFATKGVTASLANTSINTNDARGDTYSSIEGLVGSAHADRLYGNESINWIVGDAGNDIINGAGGGDKLYGDVGADDLIGGAGKDSFIFGDKSESTVSVSGRDTIHDFSGADGDRIHLAAIDANTKSSGNQAFDFIGTAGFHGKAGELRYVKQASDTYVYADINGDKKADFAIHFDDALILSKGYFIL
ncbi:calcium-binding protein [Rhizobium herbae]|uniref:Ca2+-binding RTX toxin-like protein n=1 Tax=Rhizobium herbae TaxID=508661 RepID=A0ABS4ES80_9HYPH|nr:protease [Rhizobium herbae]MBP1860794.1 Ca2+-binding RTX toxin-like protein [Rhizobium herbae]